MSWPETPTVGQKYPASVAFGDKQWEYKGDGVWERVDLALPAETDPVFSASTAFGIDTDDVNNWNTAFAARHARKHTMTSADDHDSMTADRIIGRLTTAGTPQELTGAQVKDLMTIDESKWSDETTYIKRDGSVLIGDGTPVGGSDATLFILGNPDSAATLAMSVQSATGKRNFSIDNRGNVFTGQFLFVGRTTETNSSYRAGVGIRSLNTGNFVNLYSPDDMTASVSYILPGTDGTNGQFLKTDGSGNLSFATPSASGATELDDLTDVTITSAQNGQVLLYNGTAWVNAAPPSGGDGTVTSVGLTAPTGFSVANSPITTSGNIALSYASGYSLPTNVKQSNWDDAYSASHTRLHSITNVLDHSATAHRIFYSNASGQITELAFGADGQFLKSNGASSAPSWATPPDPSGGASDLDDLSDVTITSPANNQILRYDSGTSLWTNQTAPYLTSVSKANVETAGAAGFAFRGINYGIAANTIAATANTNNSIVFSGANMDISCPTAMELSATSVYLNSGVATLLCEDGEILSESDSLVIRTDAPTLLTKAGGAFAPSIDNHIVNKKFVVDEINTSFGQFRSNVGASVPATTSLDISTTEIEGLSICVVEMTGIIISQNNLVGRFRSVGNAYLHDGTWQFTKEDIYNVVPANVTVTGKIFEDSGVWKMGFEVDNQTANQIEIKIGSYVQLREL